MEAVSLTHNCFLSEAGILSATPPNPAAPNE